MWAASILLHCGVYLAVEEVGCVEPNGSGEEPEPKHHYPGVAKVEQCGDEVFNLQLHMYGIGEG